MTIFGMPSPSSFLDISETSVEHCSGRYCSNKMLDRVTRGPPYDAEFIVADCCEVGDEEWHTHDRSP